MSLLCGPVIEIMILSGGVGRVNQRQSSSSRHIGDQPYGDAALKKVVVTEKLHEHGMAILAARKDVAVVYAQGDKNRVLEEIPDAHGILVRTLALEASDLAAATQLEVVSRHGVGCDNIAVGHCSERNIPVAIAADSNTISVIEHVMMMMLALNKRAFQYDEITRSGRFAERSQHFTSELHGKNVLIVGFGRIGKRLAPLCKAFGMHVTVADIALDHAYAAEIGVETVDDFRTRLPQTDYLTVHVPLDQSTQGLIGAAEFSALPQHAIVINCARGGVVDEAALAEAVQHNQIAATGVDVFAQEPPASDNPLLTLPNSVLTPHNAAGTAESLSRMAAFSAQNILDAFDGLLTRERLINPEILDHRK